MTAPVSGDIDLEEFVAVATDRVVAVVLGSFMVAVAISDAVQNFRQQLAAKIEKLETNPVSMQRSDI